MSFRFFCRCGAGVWGLLAGAFSGSGLSGAEVLYPNLPGIVIDVTQAPYLADPTGVEDATTAMAAAIADARVSVAGSGARFVYLPNGTYRVTRSIVIDDKTEAGGWTMIQGQSRDGVVIRLDDDAVGFDDPSNPQPVISYFEGVWTNNAFQNTFENITINTGVGNPGAVALRFISNNVGRVGNVRIHSGDGAGAIGLDLSPSISAPGIIKEVRIEGFAIGISMSNPITGAQAWLIEDIELKGQTQVGIQAHRKAVQVTDLHSVNSVPVFEGLFLDGMLTMLSSTLETPNGATVEGPAIVLRGDFAYLKDVVTTGYRDLIDDDGMVVSATTGPQTYQNGPVYKLWSDRLDVPMALPVEQTPEIPVEAPEHWMVVDPEAQGDDTEALRAALLSGARTVFLKPGLFSISDTLPIGPEVERIMGNFASIRFTVPLFASGQPVFLLGPSNRSTVVIERLQGHWLKNTDEYFIHHASNADLVLRDLLWTNGGFYRNDARTGRLFLENVHNVPGGQVERYDLPGWIITNQDVWARQFNPEMTFPLLTVDGGSFWANGFKYGEAQGPVVVARNQAKVELLGGYMNVTHGVDMNPFNTPIIDIADAQVSVRLIERAGEIYGPPKWNFRHRFVAREIFGGEERELSTRDPSIIHRDSLSRNGAGWGGAMVPLYSSAFDSALYAGNAAPVIEVAASARATMADGVLLYAEAVDSDGPAAVPSVHWKTLSGPGWIRFDSPSASLTTAWASRPGVYEITAVTSDGLQRVSAEPVTVEFTPSAMVLPYSVPSVQRLSDLAPRDGKAEVALASLFLYTGDFRTGAGEQEIRLQMETSVEPFLGAEGAIEKATLRLTPKSQQNPPAIEVRRSSATGFGLVSLSDFDGASDPIADLPSSLVTGEAIEVDVTAALIASLATGSPWLALQLRSVNGPDDNGASNFVEWHPPTASPTATRPLLTVTVAETGEASLREASALFADGRGMAPVLGPVRWTETGWVFVYDRLRWLWYAPGKGEGFHLFDVDLGWLWTHPEYYPFHYHYDRGRWLYFLEGDAAGWFYDFAASQWEFLSRP